MATTSNTSPSVLLNANLVTEVLNDLNTRRNNRLRIYAENLAASTESAIYLNPPPSLPHLSETALQMVHPSSHADDPAQALDGMLFPSSETLVRVANRIDSGKYPNHENNDLNHLHSYLLQPENTEVINFRLKDAPNGAEMSKLRGWLCTSDEVRNHQNQLIRAAVLDEVRMQNTEDAQFKSLLEMGIKKYVWDIVYNPNEDLPNPLFPETSTTPVEIQVSTSRHDEESPEPTTPSPHHDIYLDPVTGMFPPDPRTLTRNEEMTQIAIQQAARYPPQPQPELVDPSTLTPSDDEEPLPVPPPYQPHESPEARERRERFVSRSLRRGRRPEVIFRAGLAYVTPYVAIPAHINRGGVPRGARVISSVPPPPFQNDYTDAPDPNSRRSRRTICFKCNQRGHAKIHCSEYQCRYCRKQAPGHRPSHCNAGPREDSTSHDTSWSDGNHDEAANHNIDT
jgi:hypothetical protein